ncbi:MAG: archaeosortase/exosortase family protein [Chloroflexi bacterium]|nr:archaeosortase/exosortase family protein [Chloroflexota bacterium]
MAGSRSRRGPRNSAQKSRVWQRHSVALVHGPGLMRPLVVYGVTLMTLLFLYYWFVNSSLIGPFLDYNARATGWLLQLFRLPVDVQGNVVVSNPFSLLIVGECTALASLAIFTGGVIAVPSHLRSKLLGIVLGASVLSLVNVVRTASLFYVGYEYPAAYEVAHLLVWQSVMVVLAVGLWLLWVSRWAGHATA